MSTSLILGVLAVLVLSIILSLVHRPAPAPEETPEPPEPFEEIPPANDVETVTRTSFLKHNRFRREHRKELIARVENSLSPHRLHIEFDRERGIWQAWAGAKQWEDAPIRSEKRTELGALRCLLNANGTPSGNFWITAPVVRVKKPSRAKTRSAIASTPPEGRLKSA